MQLEADCIVTATEVSLPGTNIGPEYVRPTITDVSTDLPDGIYEVSFPGFTAMVRKTGSFWLAP